MTAPTDTTQHVVPATPGPVPAAGDEGPAERERIEAAAARDRLTPGHLDVGEGGLEGSGEWRSMVRWFAVTLVAGIAAVLAVNSYVDPMDLSGSTAYQPLTSEARSRQAKAQLLGALGQPPGVLVLGSSTGRGFDPAEVERLTGEPAFNGALTAGRTVDAFALASLAGERWDGREAFPHVVYMLDVDGTFRDMLPNPGLVTVPALRGQFGTVERAQLSMEVYSPYLTVQALGMSLRAVREGREQGPMPEAARRFRADGFLRRDPYPAPSPDRTRRRMAVTLERYRREIYPTREQAARLGGDSRRWLERLVEVANERGDRPTIVLLPVHPEAVEELAPYGWHERRDAVRDYLRDLAREHDLRVVDLSDAGDAGVTPAHYHDNVHLTRQGSNIVLAELARRDAL